MNPILFQYLRIPKKEISIISKEYIQNFIENKDTVNYNENIKNDL